MPADNIKRAVMRGTGELEGGQIDEILYEGYGPGGAAVLVNTATDNRNRTVSEIRHIFSKNGGNMGEQGSVSWMFERKSQIIVDAEKAGEDQLMAIALDAGGDDIRDQDGRRGKFFRLLKRMRQWRKPSRRPGSRRNPQKSLWCRRIRSSSKARMRRPC